jgi:hypothetical protein
MFIENLLLTVAWSMIGKSLQKNWPAFALRASAWAAFAIIRLAESKQATPAAAGGALLDYSRALG